MSKVYHVLYLEWNRSHRLYKVFGSFPSKDQVNDAVKANPDYDFLIFSMNPDKPLDGLVKETLDRTPRLK